MSAERTYFEKVVGDTFLCKKCSRFLSPPIYECVNGHIVCNPCYEIMKCITCAGAKCDAPSKALEEIHSKIRFPCENHGRNCTFIGSWVEVKEHEKICPNIPKSPSKSSAASPSKPSPPGPPPPPTGSPTSPVKPPSKSI